MVAMKQVFAVLLVVLGLSQVQASERGGVFIEPMLTYQDGQVEISYPIPVSTSKEDITGHGFGLRLGGHLWQSLFLAIDGRYNKLDYDSSALGDSTNADSYDVGATIGIQTPLVGLRFWGTYLFSGELNPNEISSVEYKLKNLTGYRVGLGIKIVFASINLEYEDATYDKASFTSLGPFNPGDVEGIDGENKNYILSISFPFSL